MSTISRIEIHRYFDYHGAQHVDVEAVDGNGEELELLEALGLLEVAKLELSANAVLSLVQSKEGHE